MEKAIDALIAQVEDEDFSDLFDQLERIFDRDQDPEPIDPPASKVDARRFLSALRKIEDDMEFYRKEYLPHLVEKFIEPVKKKIDTLEMQKVELRRLLQDYLAEAGEKKVPFPDIGTISLGKTQPSLIYPEDEDAFIKKLVEDGKEEYVVRSPKLNKKKLLEDFKTTGETPVDGLQGRPAGLGLKITWARAKKSSEEEDE